MASTVSCASARAARCAPPRGADRRASPLASPSGASARGGAAPAARRVVLAAARVVDDDDRSSASPRQVAAARSTRRGAILDAALLLASSAALPAFAEEGVEAAVEPVAPVAPAPPPAVPPPKPIALVTVDQPVMAYSFAYPSVTSEDAPIRWTPSRQRDTYSSAEPMSPDARQRIVYELISFKGPMTATVTVGPAPPKLAGKDKSAWTPSLVAEAVLADRATGRIATGQKVSLAEVESATRERREDGTEYIYYEYISQGSPNLSEREATTFRHSVGATAIRGDYLYTYTISAPETLWDVNAAGFEQGVRSFRLTKPDKKKFREPGNEGILPPLPF